MSGNISWFISAFLGIGWAFIGSSYVRGALIVFVMLVLARTGGSKETSIGTWTFHFIF